MQPQYRSIVLFGGHGADRNDDLYRAIADAGFKIVEDRLVCCVADTEPPLDRVVRLNDEQRVRIQSHGIHVLSHFQYFSFKDVWYWLGGDQTSGFTFVQLCQRLKEAKLAFQDLNTDNLYYDHRAYRAWRQHGLDGALSGLLMRLGIVSEQMLVAFTPDELSDIRGIGRGSRLAALVALQEKLRRPRAVS